MKRENLDFPEIFPLYPPNVRPLAPPIFLGNAGGFSGARFWKYDSAIGPLALKSWPSDGPKGQRLRWIHGEMRKAKSLGFIPVPIRDMKGNTFQETSYSSWEIFPWLPGIADRSRPPSLPHLRAGFKALAALHRLWEDEKRLAPSLGLERRLMEIQTWRLEDFSLLEAALKLAPDDLEKTLAIRWLELARRGTCRRARTARGIEDGSTFADVFARCSRRPSLIRRRSSLGPDRFRRVGS